jgi:hypothetical protein
MSKGQQSLSLCRQRAKVTTDCINLYTQGKTQHMWALKPQRIVVPTPHFPSKSQYIFPRRLLGYTSTLPVNLGICLQGSALKGFEFFWPSCIVTTNHHTVGPRANCTQNSIFCIGFSVWWCNSQIPGYAIGWLGFTTNGAPIDAINYISNQLTKVMVNFLCHKLPSSNWEVFSNSEE